MGVPNEGGTRDCPISASLPGDTLRRACFSKVGFIVASFAGADPFGCIFVPRCGINDGEGEDIGRGVVGICEGASPSVCFFIAGKTPEFCLVAGQFAPETGALEGTDDGLADIVGPPAPAVPRCCLVTEPLPGG